MSNANTEYQLVADIRNKLTPILLMVQIIKKEKPNFKSKILNDI